MRPKYLVTILILLALAVPASPVHAGGIVSICDEAHLLAALTGGGTVTFTCSGTIALTATVTIPANTTIDGSGQDVTISGNNAVRVFTVYSGKRLNLDRLTIANGSSYEGGGISNAGILTVSNSTFSGNRAVNASGGGGIFNYNNSILTVSNSTFSNNSACETCIGGGISNYGTVIVNNSTFSGNSSDSGGGIWNGYNDTLTVNNSTFSGNTANVGGGISAGGTVTVSRSTFDGNTANYSGGGIYSSGTLIVSNSTFSGNTTRDGGGIFNGSYGTLTVTNSTFYSNTATGNGGGILNYDWGTTVTVSNSTFSGNSATSGGGIYNSEYASTITLKNTIVANSPTGSNCVGAITDGGGNLSYPDTSCPGGNNDPLLGSLQNNGGPTETMGLGPGSAALDAANDAICAATPVNNHDQRSIVRPQGPHCDIGAVEEYCPNFVHPATVGVEDILAIAARWGWTDSTPRWDPVYDLNGDNKIDIVDITLVTAAWGRACS